MNTQMNTWKSSSRKNPQKKVNTATSEISPSKVTSLFSARNSITTFDKLAFSHANFQKFEYAGLDSRSTYSADSVVTPMRTFLPPSNSEIHHSLMGPILLPHFPPLNFNESHHWSLQLPLQRILLSVTCKYHAIWKWLQVSYLDHK